MPATAYLKKSLAGSALIKSIDPSAKVMAPEEWGWEGYFGIPATTSNTRPPTAMVIIRI